MMAPRETFVARSFDDDLSDVAAGDALLWQVGRVERRAMPTTKAARAATYPMLFFNAFHPDLVRVRGPEGRIAGPLAGNHSALAFYGWQRELSVAQTVRLFGDDAFERLGYARYWETARSVMLEVAEAADLPLDVAFERWARTGCFMHTVNHPKFVVLADLARAVAQRAGIALAFDRPEDAFPDPFGDGPSWPVYPELAARLGFAGNYAFKPARSPGEPQPALLDLEVFVAASFACYERFGRSALVCPRLVDDPAYRDLERPACAANGAAQAARANDVSPYADLPDLQFWRRAVEHIAPHDVDPYVGAPLPVGPRTRVATAGSCFAQHLSRALDAAGYTHYVAEPAPPGMVEEEARRLQFGVYSARYGNVYTARQLVQLIDRAYGAFEPLDTAWRRADGRWVDPFRPEIEPDGFASPAFLAEVRAGHLACVRGMLERLDVLLFTLGQTEAWYRIDDGAVFPLAPGVRAAGDDGAAYGFRNFSVDEVVGDLEALLQRLARVNANARVVLTVSPVPLVATYAPRHVLVSSTASKAILRAAVDEIVRRHAEVAYFPSYEIVTGAFNRGAYFGTDLRSPTAEGIDHVMRVFFAHCADGTPRPAPNIRLSDAIARDMDVVCDEDLLARS